MICKGSPENVDVVTLSFSQWSHATEVAFIFSWHNNIGLKLCSA